MKKELWIAPSLIQLETYNWKACIAAFLWFWARRNAQRTALAYITNSYRNTPIKSLRTDCYRMMNGKEYSLLYEYLGGKSVNSTHQYHQFNITLNEKRIPVYLYQIDFERTKSG